jgi:hypothetical protein
MNSLSAVVFTLALGVLASCGKSERDEVPGWSSSSTGGAPSNAGAAGGGSGGTLDSGGVPESPCEGERAFPIWGKPYDPERDCIDTETTLENIACTIQPAPDASVEEQYYSDGFSCVRRLADGKMYWVFAFNRLGFDPNLWERCPNEPALAPVGCYAAGCVEAPRSSCSFEETKKRYDCSATGEYDENCCGRQPCEVTEDCAGGEECRAVPSFGQWWCWDNPGNACDCGGPFGGLKMLCMPKTTGEGGAAGADP